MTSKGIALRVGLLVLSLVISAVFVTLLFVRPDSVQWVKYTLGSVFFSGFMTANVLTNAATRWNDE